MSSTSLRRSDKQCFYAKASKCTFCSSELEYLGHMVGRDRIKVNPRTVSAVVDWHPPSPTAYGMLRQGLEVLIVDLFDQL